MLGYGYSSMLSNFRVEKKIGRGQFSEVYKATCLLDNQQVALKKVQVILDIYTRLYDLYFDLPYHIYYFCNMYNMYKIKFSVCTEF